MSETPEALRLADEYASDGWIAGTRQWCEEAAAELRRQHAEIEQLREQNTIPDAACAKLEKGRDGLLAVLIWISEYIAASPPELAGAHKWNEIARAAIAKVEGNTV